MIKKILKNSCDLYGKTATLTFLGIIGLQSCDREGNYFQITLKCKT